MPDNTTPLQQVPEKEYKVSFTFTTFNTSKSMATGRSGTINVVSVLLPEDMDTNELKQLCVNEMLRMKPKWNILMLDIKSISPVVPKKAKAKSNART